MEKVLAVAVLMLQVLQASGKDPGEAYMQCIAGTFVEGESALLICDFAEDVSKGDFSFFVEHFPVNSDKKVEDILKCNTKDDCEWHPDFKFDYNITSKLKLEIPVVKVKHAGIYTCQHVPPGEKPKKACRLEVKEKNQIEATKIPIEGKTTKVPRTEQNTEANHIPGYVALGIGIFVLILLFIFGIIVGVWKRNKLRKCFQRSETRSNAETSTETYIAAAFNELMKELSKSSRRKLKKQNLDDPTSIFGLDPKEVEHLELSLGDKKRLLAKIDSVKSQKEGCQPEATPLLSKDNETEDENCKQEEDKEEGFKTSDENKDAKKTEDKEKLSSPGCDETMV